VAETAPVIEKSLPRETVPVRAEVPKITVPAPVRATPFVLITRLVVVEKVVVELALKPATVPELNVKNVAPVPPKPFTPSVNVTVPADTRTLRAVALPVTV
jgi:hypothetical protein